MSAARKKYAFMGGLPRSGNTLLSALLNQNPAVHAGPNSLLPEAMWRLWTLRDTNWMKIFPDYRSWKNMLSSLFDSYYADTKAEWIIDRGPWGLQNNLGILKTFVEPRPKFIVPLRPVEEVAASFLRLTYLRADDKDIDAAITELMDDNFILAKSLASAKNIVLSHDPELVHIVHYSDLVSNPEAELARLYAFLGLEPFRHNTQNVGQFRVNDVRYIDKIDTLPGMHKLKDGGITGPAYSVNEYVPQHWLDRLQSMNFWLK